MDYTVHDSYQNPALFGGTFDYKDTRRVFSLQEVSSSPYIDTLAKDAQLSVLATLARTRAGFNTDLVTPMIGRSEPDKLAARARFRDDVLKVVANLDPSFKPLIDAEHVQATKVGPTSIMLPFTERRTELYRYYSVPKYDKQSFKYCELAYEKFKSGLPHHKLDPTSLDQAFINMPKGTNLGAPFFRKTPDNYPELMVLAREFEKGGFDVHKYNHACMLYWRGQATGLTTPVKQRGVWGYPHFVSLHEFRLMAPIIELFKRLNGFSALVSSDKVNRRMTEFIKDDRIKYSIDFSSCDQFALPLVGFAFDAMRWMFKRKHHRIIDMVEDRFRNIPLLTPDGIWTGEHGVPSGAGPTNWVDSLVNRILGGGCALAAGTDLDDWEGQGDDGVWLFRKDPGLEHITEFARSMGMYVGVDKGGVSTDNLLYLQNVYMRVYQVDALSVGVRPLERLLPGLLGFETPRDKAWRPVDTSFRWIQQVENAKYHPFFESIVRLLFQHDRMLRDFTIRELIDIGGGLTEIEAREKSSGFPYGKEPLSELAQFATVKVLEKLRKQLKGNVPDGDWWFNPGPA